MMSLFPRSKPLRSSQSVWNGSYGGPWSQKLILKVNNLCIKFNAQNCAGQVLSNHSFKVSLCVTIVTNVSLFVCHDSHVNLAELAVIWTHDCDVRGMGLFAIIRHKLLCIPVSKKFCVTVISGRLPAGNVLIFPQTVVGAGYRKVRVMWSFLNSFKTVTGEKI